MSSILIPIDSIVYYKDPNDSRGILQKSTAINLVDRIVCCFDGQAYNRYIFRHYEGFHDTLCVYLNHREYIDDKCVGGSNCGYPVHVYVNSLICNDWGHVCDILHSDKRLKPFTMSKYLDNNQKGTFVIPYIDYMCPIKPCNMIQISRADNSDNFTYMHNFITLKSFSASI